MRFRNQAGAGINSLAEWKDLGKPAATHHWAEGRSAAELARDWIEGNATRRAANLLEQAPGLGGVTLELGIAEKKTYFDDIASGPRNHDLLILGSADSGGVVVGVEGKADEPFDDPLPTWRDKRVKATATSKAPLRLDRLTTYFFGSTLDSDERLDTVGYQLVSARGDSRRGVHGEGPWAVLLIHEFVTSKTNDEKPPRTPRRSTDSSPSSPAASFHEQDPRTPGSPGP